MVERDYLMRMLQEFFDAIAKVVRRDIPGIEPDLSQIQKRFNEIYNQFFRCPAEHYYGIDKEEILNELEKEGYSDSDMYAKIHMLSELLYQDALIKSNIQEKCALLGKSLFLLEYLDRNSRTYSWDRVLKIGDIKKALTEFNI